MLIWQDPLSVTEETVVEFLRLQSRPDKPCFTINATDLRRSVVIDQTTAAPAAVVVFGDKVTLDRAAFTFEQGAISISLRTAPQAAGAASQKTAVIDHLTELIGSSPKRGIVRSGNGASNEYESSVWDQSGFRVLVYEKDQQTTVAVIPNSRKDTPTTEPSGITVDLDVLLAQDTFWQWTTEKFERQYVAKTEGQQSTPPQFEWLSSAKERARFSRKMFSNIDTRLTMFGGSVKVEEAIVEFVNGRAARATISFYNRGDSGEIRTQDFEAIFKRIGQNLGQALKVAPKSQLGSSNAALKVTGWNWTTPKSIALLEYNDYTARSSAGGSQQPEFLRLKLAAADQADFSMGRLAVGVGRMAAARNVTKNGAGDVYIGGVPMVDQGAKGYCVAASCQRLFEYFQIPCDQHELANLVSIDADSGANAFDMQKSLAKIDGRFNVSFKPHVNPELYYDKNRKRRVSFKEFAGLVKEHTDKGTPMLWALLLGEYPEEPPLKGSGQVSGGHMRLIIGYNSAKNQVLFTDSWGAGHELKRMDASNAYECTIGLYSMSPRGL